jgi:hypothetical protein
MISRALADSDSDLGSPGRAVTITETDGSSSIWSFLFFPKPKSCSSAFSPGRPAEAARFAQAQIGGWLSQQIRRRDLRSWHRSMRHGGPSLDSRSRACVKLELQSVSVLLKLIKNVVFTLKEMNLDRQNAMKMTSMCLNGS